MNISIIIPTLNEEQFIGRLLERLNRFDISDDIIVCDNNSTDRTREIAREHGARVIDGGIPAVARNEGSLKARYDTLLFLDADVIIQPNLREICEHNFNGEHRKCLSFRHKPLSRSLYHKAIYGFLNIYNYVVSGAISPQGLGSAIAVDKQLFLEKGMFDPKVTAGEDFAFLGKIARKQHRYVTDSVIYTSPRRFHGWQQLMFYLNLPIWSLFRLLRIKRDIVSYKHTHKYNHIDKETEYIERHQI